MKTLRSAGGFTLIELLIVILIIGVLAGIAVPVFLGQQTRAAISEAKTNLQILRTLQEEYYADRGYYAPYDAGAGTDGNAFYSYDPGTDTSDLTIQDTLPRFQPGNPLDLNFEYELRSTGGTGQGFIAIAVGKTPSRVEGTVFTLDNTNAEGTTVP
jgi:prepilin-type N-terminal cleavage/methylation domain-containing protein